MVRNRGEFMDSTYTGKEGEGGVIQATGFRPQAADIPFLILSRKQYNFLPRPWY